MEEMIEYNVNPIDERKDHVIYNGRKINVCLKAGSYDKHIEVFYNGLIGDLIATVKDRRTVFTHVLTSQDLEGYSKEIRGSFEVSRKNFDEYFYAYYYKVADRERWRCPAPSLDEAWEHSSEA